MERIPPEGPDAQGGPGHLWDRWWGAVASQPGPLLIPEAAKISRDIPRALWKQWGVEGQWPCSAPGQPCQTEQREKGDSKIIPVLASNSSPAWKAVELQDSDMLRKDLDLP